VRDYAKYRGFAGRLKSDFLVTFFSTFGDAGSEFGDAVICSTKQTNPID
jgi:hypothetical protein